VETDADDVLRAAKEIFANASRQAS
jgi:hypothetical protein